MKIESWFNSNDTTSIYSSDYWNNEEIEKNKIWNVNEENFKDLEDHLKNKTNLYDAFNSGLDLIEKIIVDPKGYTCLDLAAGVCWSSALLSRKLYVKEIFALEISIHRLKKIAPIVINGLSSQANKIKGIIGDFYNLKVEDNSIDLVVLSQAFHHADKPNKLLGEINRVLKPGAICFITGEKLISLKQNIFGIIKHNIKKIIFDLNLEMFFKKNLNPLKVNKFSYKFKNIFPPDEEMGNHYYRKKDIECLMREAWLQIIFQQTRVMPSQVSKGTFNYILIKK